MRGVIAMLTLLCRQQYDGLLMTGFLLTGLTTGVFPKNDHVLFSEVFFLKAGYRQDVTCDVTVGSL